MRLPIGHVAVRNARLAVARERAVYQQQEQYVIESIAAALTDLDQAYVLARLGLKLVFYASQTAYFQGQLAHASYVAAPQAVWPESPAAEAIGGTPHEP